VCGSDLSSVKLAGSSPTICDVRDLVDGTSVDQVLLVRGREIRRTRAGAEWMRLSLADRTGVVPAVVWDDIEEAVATATAGDPVRVIGSFSEHPRYGPQLTVQSVLAPLEVDWERLVDSPATPVAELERRLDSYIAGLTEPNLAPLMERLLGNGSDTGRAFRRAFATQYNHHAYRSGLLEHSLQVADAITAAAGIVPDVNHDLAVCGALLHDIGKLDAYSHNGHCAELNDTGKLVGEIPSGYFTVRRCVEDLPGFPRRLADALLHIILSHHGCLEHGSPVVPATREALLVHTMDKLSGDLGSFDRLERETTPDDSWSRYDRALGRAVLLGGRGRAAA
jgi:3'-5' exoribonuclease